MMNQVQRASTGGESKKFWSKVKQSSKGFTSSFGNLSIHSEQDGNTENDTIVHKAILNYYTSRNLPPPSWFGVPEFSAQSRNSVYMQQQQHQQQPQQQYQPQMSPQRQRRTSDHQVPQMGPEREQERMNMPQERRGVTSNSKYSLSDIYNRSASDGRKGQQQMPPQQMSQQHRHQQQPPMQQQSMQQQSMPPQQLQYRPAPTRSQTYNVNDENRDMGYGGMRANSASSNRLKERAQKQNKQSFESYASNSGASFTSSKTGSSSRSNIFRRN